VLLRISVGRERLIVQAITNVSWVKVVQRLEAQDELARWPSLRTNG